MTTLATSEPADIDPKKGAAGANMSPLDGM